MVKKRISKSNVRPNTTECRSVFKKKYNRLALSFMSILLLGGVTNAHAETTCVDITAQVSRVDDDSALLHDSIKPGDIITGKYVYDLATPNTSQEYGATGGAYMHNTAPYGITLNVGGFVFRTNPDNVAFYMGIGNDHEVTTEERTYLEDGFGIISYSNIFDISTPDQKNILTNQGYYTDLLIGLWLVDDSASAISDIDLPKQPPTLEDWPTTNQLDISYDSMSLERGHFLVRAKLTSAVPCAPPLPLPTEHKYLVTSEHCGLCHQSATAEQRIGVHSKAGSACKTCHGSKQADVVAAIAAGRNQENVECTTCHNNKSTGLPTHPTTKHNYINASESCAKCHDSGTKADIINNLHKAECKTCHNSTKPAVIAAMAVGRAQKNIDCKTCHNGTPDGAITHKKPAPKIEFVSDRQSVSENAGTVSVAFALSTPSKLDVKVPFSVGGTAKGGGIDHNLSSGSITIPAGKTSGTLSFKVNNDSIYEKDESVIISMEKPSNADIGAVGVHTVIIKDDDPKPFVFFKPASQLVKESVGKVEVTALLSNAADEDITLPYTVGGTAKGNGVDHDLSNGTISIPAGKTSGKLSFKVINDSICETDKTVVVKMGSPNIANSGASVHIVTIADDDKTK